MPPADAALSTAAASVTLTQIRTRVSGWGGGGGVPVRLVRPRATEEMTAALELARDDGIVQGIIARGMGRSYGDAAQLRDGVVLDTTELKGMELDLDRGVVTAEAGVT